MKKVFTLRALLFFLLFMGSKAFSQTAGKFSIVGKDIYDPCGNIFFPVGANLNGPNWVWSPTCKGGSDRFKNVWKFNTARINMLLKSGYNGDPTFPEGYNMWSQNNLTTLDEIITEYTSKKIVVQLELHDWTGSYPSGQDLIDLKNWWVMIAQKYDGNEYVWYNAFNEPGAHQANPVSVQYRDVHRTLVQAIRDEAGSDNVIVIDGAAYGQDVGGTYNANLVQEQRSGILTYGNDIKNFNNKTYQNIAFAIHVYGQWGFGTDQQRATKMIDYIDRVHAKNLSLHIGELGWYCNNTTDPEALGTKTAYEVAPAKGVGVIAWHGQPGDGMALPSCSGNGNILSFSTLPSLSWTGQYIVPIAQQKGAVACSGTTTDTQAPTAPTGLNSPSKTSTSVSLSWTAATDNVGVTSYDVFVGGVYKTNVTSTSATVTGLSASTSYSFTVKAKDAAGNSSVASSSLSVTTNAGSGSTNLVQNGGFESDLNNWSVTGGTGVITTTNVQGGAKALQVGSTAYSWVQQNISGYTVGDSYTFSAWGKGAVKVGIKTNLGNIQEFSFTSTTSYEQQTATITVPSGATYLQVYITNGSSGTEYADNIQLVSGSSDTQAPTVPTGLSSPSKTQTSVNLTWTSSTDNVGVASYDVFVNGVYNKNSTTNSTTISGLTANTAYNFTVKAKDAAGNVSAASSALSVTTSANTSANMLLNHSFENNLTNWSVTGGTGVIDAANVQDGSKALKVGSAAYSWVQQNISGYTEGTTYTFSAWGKVDATIGLKGSTGTLAVFNFTSSGYTQQTATVTVPTGTTWLQVYITNGSSGTGYADNISLTSESSSISSTNERLAVLTSETEEPYHNISIFPNPASTSVNITYFSDEDKQIKVQLLDVSGKTHIKMNKTVTKGSNDFSVDTHDLVTGIYYLNIINGKNQITKKVIITQ